MLQVPVTSSYAMLYSASDQPDANFNNGLNYHLLAALFAGGC